MPEEKMFRFILLKSNIFIDSVQACNLLGVMLILLQRVEAGTYSKQVKPVKKNVRIGFRKWKRLVFPGGVVIVSNNGKKLYQLEFADTVAAVKTILSMDIENLKKQSQGGIV